MIFTEVIKGGENGVMTLSGQHLPFDVMDKIDYENN